MSLLPPTFFAENGFLQLMICLLLFYCLSSLFQGNISQSYLRTEGLGQGIYGDALVDITFKNYLDSSSCCRYTEKTTREEAMGGNKYWRQRGTDRCRAGVCQGRSCKLLEYIKVTDYIYQQIRRREGFLERSCPSSILVKRSRTQKKDVCRDMSGLDSSQFRMVAWQTNCLPWMCEFLISKSLF